MSKARAKLLEYLLDLQKNGHITDKELIVRVELGDLQFFKNLKQSIEEELKKSVEKK